MPPTTGTPGGAGELGVAPSMAAVACAYARATGTVPTSFPINHYQPLGFTPYPDRPAAPAVPDRRAQVRPTEELTDAQTHLHRQRQAGARRLRRTTSGCSGSCATCSASTGPKYGCGLDVCKACTCHINGKAFNPCSVPVSEIKPTDQITTIEGLPATVGKPLHPMQEAWLEYDVAQCGYCQPGQIMTAVALVEQARRRDARSPTPTSTRSATSAAAAPTPGSARRSWPAPRTCPPRSPSRTSTITSLSQPSTTPRTRCTRRRLGRTTRRPRASLRGKWTSSRSPPIPPTEY